MKIYVAGASREVDMVLAFQAELRAAGHEITHDWATLVKAAAVPDRAMTHDAMSAAAIDDLRGVSAASLLWLLVPAGDSTSVGAWVELGAALAWGKFIVASGDAMRSIFLSQAARTFASHTEALRYIVSMGTGACFVGDGL